MSIRRRSGYRSCANGCGSTWPVIDHHRLPYSICQKGANQTRHDIAGSAGRECHDELDGLRRPCLSPSRQRNKRRPNESGGKGKLATTNHVHSKKGQSPSLFSVLE